MNTYEVTICIGTVVQIQGHRLCLVGDYVCIENQTYDAGVTKIVAMFRNPVSVVDITAKVEPVTVTI